MYVHEVELYFRDLRHGFVIVQWLIQIIGYGTLNGRRGSFDRVAMLLFLRVSLTLNLKWFLTELPIIVSAQAPFVI